MVVIFEKCDFCYLGNVVFAVCLNWKRRLRGGGRGAVGGSWAPGGTLLWGGGAAPEPLGRPDHPSPTPRGSVCLLRQCSDALRLASGRDTGVCRWSRRDSTRQGERDLHCACFHLDWSFHLVSRCGLYDPRRSRLSECHWTSEGNNDRLRSNCSSSMDSPFYLLKTSWLIDIQRSLCFIKCLVFVSCSHSRNYFIARLVIHPTIVNGLFFLFFCRLGLISESRGEE